MVYGVLILVLCGLFSDALAYVPSCQPLMMAVTKFTQQQRPDVVIKGKDFVPVHIEERDGFACIDGVDAFEQAVVQASHARPVLVFFFAQRDLQSQKLWQMLQPLVKELGTGQDKKTDFVAVDIFRGSGEELENQNYQIAIRCMESVGMPSMQLPVVVFFKDGLMCSTRQAIFTGNVQLPRVKLVMQQLLSHGQKRKKL